MRKNLNSRTVTTVNFVGTAHAVYEWTPADLLNVEIIDAYAEAHESNAQQADYVAEFGSPEVFEYNLPGLRVVALVHDGQVDTVFTVSDDTATHLHTAVRKSQPVTITYVKADGEETVRTIEPTSLSLTKAGDVIVKATDRKSDEVRSFRLDRVRFYTVHRTAFTVRHEAPAPTKAELVRDWTLYVTDPEKAACWDDEEVLGQLAEAYATGHRYAKVYA